MDADAPVPLPEDIARRMSPFHRLMRTKGIGLVLIASILLVLGIHPLVAVGPSLLFLTWIGVFRAEGMQRFLDYASGLYLSIIVILMENIFWFRVRTFGHKEKFKRRSLFIMNHICHFDWMFFWSVVERNGDIGSWKAVTKNIKHAPFLGLCMQYANHIFITRRWETDEEEFKKKLFYYNILDLPVQLLLFPEGGDLTGKSRAKSDSYADTNGLKRYEYCLHPRAKGFLYMIQALRSGRLDAVYDITVGYPDALAKTEGDFVKGNNVPREIHYHIRCYKSEDLPADEEGLTHWLEERWGEKEEMLRLFYAHRRFMEPAKEGSQTTTEENGVSSPQNTEYRPVPEVVMPKPYAFIAFAFAFYTFLMVLFTYFLFLHWVWTLCVVGMAIWTFVKGLGSGIDVVLPDRNFDRIEAAYNQWRKMKATSSETQ